MVLEPRRTAGSRVVPDGEELRLELAVDRAVPSIVRTRLRRWLDELGWTPDDADDVVLAVHEAAANVVDHAYLPGEPGTVRVTARAAVAGTGVRIEVRVRDHGRWRPAAADPGYRGHGLTVMRGCMDTVDVTAGADGTEVRMVSRTVLLQVPLLRETGHWQTVHVAAGVAPSRPAVATPAELRLLRRGAAAARRTARLLVARSRQLVAAAIVLAGTRGSRVQAAVVRPSSGIIAMPRVSTST